MGDIDLVAVLVLYVVLVVSLVCHEAAHALFAKLGGDLTAYMGGQVTLNPIPHMRREPFGTIILPLGMLLLSGGAWCLGFASTPIDPLWAHRHPRRAALMSAAGPLTNFALMGLAFAVLYIMAQNDVVRVSYSSRSLLEFVQPMDGSKTGALYASAMILNTFMALNLLLGILNLYPLPPLDGAGVVEGLFPKTQGFYSMIRSQPMLVILGVVVIWMTIHEPWLRSYVTLLDWLE